MLPIQFCLLPLIYLEMLELAIIRVSTFSISTFKKEFPKRLTFQTESKSQHINLTMNYILAITLAAQTLQFDSLFSIFLCFDLGGGRWCIINDSFAFSFHVSLCPLLPKAYSQLSPLHDNLIYCKLLESVTSCSRKHKNFWMRGNMKSSFKSICCSTRLIGIFMLFSHYVQHEAVFIISKVVQCPFKTCCLVLMWRVIV